MALVVFLRGVNVGGHKTFRPSALAKELKRFDVVNVGAAGTFVVRKPVSHAKLRAEILRRLPFEAQLMICDARDILRLVSSDPFPNHTLDRTITCFFSVLAAGRVASCTVPLSFPDSGRWCLKVLSRDDRFVLGQYRREMKAIGYLGQLDKVFGVPATTRSWNTILAIARILKSANVD